MKNANPICSTPIDCWSRPDHLFYNSFLILLFTIFPFQGFSQAVLNADGPGNTYELINSVFAPSGGDVVENPECVHPEFGRHIAEVWDADLNQYVFEFYIHVTPDNDRCINFDRQRVEIKTYDSSPDSLKGTRHETIVYKWKFKIPTGYQPSSNFTHLHQIKAVGGDEADPIFTLTARKGNPNRLELIHNNTNKVAIANLSLFENTWVEATEIIMVDSLHGSYSIDIKKVSDGISILSYRNNDLMTIRYNNSFIRPKWGIYRSLLSSTDLRDEAVRFNGFSIYEVPGPKDQFLTFPLISMKGLSDSDFSPAAWSTSNLPVSYVSSNESVATIVNNKIHIVGLGATTITASQSGNLEYYPADNVSQLLIVANLSLTINPIADSYVHGANPTTNYGTAATLQLKENGTSSYTRKSFCKFDLAGTDFAKIYGAKFRLYSNGITAGTSTPISISASAGNWNENEITFSNAPTADSLLTTEQVANDLTYYDFDITSYVQNCLAKNSLVSLLISDNSGANTLIKFNSREAVSNHPELFLAGISSNLPTLELQKDKNKFQIYYAYESKSLILNFTLLQNSNLNIAILNSVGQLIRCILVKQNQSEGTFQQTFPMSDLPAGIYFVRISSGNVIQTTKLNFR
ncbi:MAG: DNRLRE domain-containing protein [Bacteroidales bacterium]|nr:DNRLRE domain-containing protein [Bacteroidales bacterium]